MVLLAGCPFTLMAMARASRVVAETLAMLRREVRPGITTDELDRLAEQFIRSHGGTPAFKGYRNYPKTLCASINDQVVHGIPSKRALKEGDIIGLDLGAIVDGFYGDSAVTVAVGKVSPRIAELLKVTEASLFAGIAQAVVGNRLSDISHDTTYHTS